MAKTVNIYEAKTHLSRLVDEASQGEEIVIARHGHPVARLVALAEKPKEKRPLGLFKGQIWVAPDFDETPEELIAAFEGRDDEGEPCDGQPGSGKTGDK
ncbi:MAG: type II toxin-antitoxin system Phd/YefM family antitoxin [Alphaproteobacteria bacterium]|nr:type II toxin-antitoxin system Phd/YefM family antitoxin [Alphaproteobacteria bacterium]